MHLPDDPWSIPSARTERSRGSRVLKAGAVILVGASGAVLRAATDDTAAAIALGVLSIVWLCALRAISSRPRCLPAGLVLTLTLAIAATAPRLGPTPAAVMTSGVLLAHGALFSWSPWSGWPQRPAPTADVSILLTALAGLSWWRTGDPAVAFLLLLAAMVMLELSARRTGARRADRFVATALARVGTSLSLLLVGLVALPLLYLPGFIGRLLPSRRKRGGWVVDEVGASDRARDAHRPFAGAPARLRRRRAATGLVATFVGTSLLWGAVVAISPDSSPEDPFLRAREVELSSLESFSGDPFADELKAEQDEFANEHIRLDPITVSAMTDFAGRYTTVTDGVRATPAPPACECRRFSVWFVGGSAAFGLGQRDHRTIAAGLVDRAADQGVALEVRNLAVPGWTIHQEWLAVDHRLSLGERPDAVVFYNGFNDLTSAFIEASVRRLDPTRPNLLIAEDLQEAQDRGFDLVDASGADVASVAAERYLSVLRQADRRLNELGIPAAFVLQPDAFASEVQIDSIRPTLDPALLEAVGALGASLERFEQLVAPETLNLRHHLDSLARPVYADTVHTNEDAASVIAARLTPEVLRLPRAR